MGLVWLSILLASVGCTALAALAMLWMRRRRLRRAAERVRPTGRPLEVIACDARRLAARWHHLPRGTSFAKVEAVRYAYDHVLAEACTALNVEHLLEVLPPGDELDAERRRVESALWLAGLRIEEPA